MTCNCSLCKDARKWNDIEARGDVDEMRALIGDLRIRVWDAEDELARCTAILDGSAGNAKAYACAIIQTIIARECAELNKLKKASR